MENFDMKAFNDKIMESLACLDKNIDIKKKPPTPGKTILRYFPEDYMRFNQPFRRELFIEENKTTEDENKEEQEEQQEQEKPENNEEKENTMDQPERVDRATQKYNFSFLPRNTRPIAISKFRNVNRGVFFESNKIDDTQANQKKKKSREEKTAPNVKPMEEKLKGVLENLKARSKEIKPEKRTVKVIDVIQPALKKRKGSR